ncbi:hypothetical protein RJT34_05077 [Clitoria ternatea]|uniref:Uncharacterized protein n=1 Tax=Clitoria ternatea TaxID=43366 RepID=A0AAN9K2B1_CLITE
MLQLDSLDRRGCFYSLDIDIFALPSPNLTVIIGPKPASHSAYALFSNKFQAADNPFHAIFQPLHTLHLHVLDLSFILSSQALLASQLLLFSFDILSTLGF